jgi:hypothetical protein
MTSAAVRWRRGTEPVVRALLLGAAVGFVVLGIGGRLAMRAIAVANHVPAGFTFDGTTTVVLLGVVSGIAGALLYALLHRYIQRRRLVRSALFTLALVLLTLRGLRPIQPLALEWFMPLAVAYGAIVDVVYTWWAGRRASRASGEAPTSAYPGGA